MAIVLSMACAVRPQGRMNSLQQPHDVRLRGQAGGWVAAGAVDVAGWDAGGSAGQGGPHVTTGRVRAFSGRTDR
jgi:hypothetical protein